VKRYVAKRSRLCLGREARMSRGSGASAISVVSAFLSISYTPYSFIPSVAAASVLLSSTPAPHRPYYSYVLYLRCPPGSPRIRRCSDRSHTLGRRAGSLPIESLQMLTVRARRRHERSPSTVNVSSFASQFILAS